MNADGSTSIENNAVERVVPTGRFELSTASAYNYILPKTIGSLTIGCMVGASVGHFVGDKLAVYLYSGGIMAGVAGTTFHGGAYLLETIRKENDFVNFSGSGAVHGLAIGSSMYGIKRGAVLSAVGGVLGASYFFGSDWLYKNARKAWINNRRYTLENSKEKKIAPRQQMFPPRDLPAVQTNPEQAEKIRRTVSAFFGGVSEEPKDK